MSTATINSVTREPVYLLHSRNYRETSLLIDVFSLNYGLLRLVVKGALRPSNPLKGMLQLFQPLLISWQGRSDLKNLIDVEFSRRLPTLKGDYLYSALYLNELIVRLVHSNDPSPQLFSAYADAIGGLVEGEALEAILRVFEFKMLTELGAFPSFTEEAGSGQSINLQAYYYWQPEQGFIRVSRQNQYAQINSIRGAQLAALSVTDFSRKETLFAAKRLSRLMIDHLMGGRSLKSRELIAKSRELKRICLR